MFFCSIYSSQLELMAAAVYIDSTWCMQSKPCLDTNSVARHGVSTIKPKLSHVFKTNTSGFHEITEVTCNRLRIYFLSVDNPKEVLHWFVLL